MAEVCEDAEDCSDPSARPSAEGAVDSWAGAGDLSWIPPCAVAPGAACLSTLAAGTSAPVDLSVRASDFSSLCAGASEAELDAAGIATNSAEGAATGAKVVPLAAIEGACGFASRPDAFPSERVGACAERVFPGAGFWPAGVRAVCGFSLGRSARFCEPESACASV